MIFRNVSYGLCALCGCQEHLWVRDERFISASLHHSDWYWPLSSLEHFFVIDMENVSRMLPTMKSISSTMTSNANEDERKREIESITTIMTCEHVKWFFIYIFFLVSLHSIRPDFFYTFFYIFRPNPHTGAICVTLETKSNEWNVNVEEKKTEWNETNREKKWKHEQCFFIINFYSNTL